MAQIVTVLVVLVAGFTSAPGWLIVLAAVALTVQGWVAKLHLLQAEPRVPLTSKMITYFVTGVLANLAGAWLCYIAGWGLRRLVS